MTKQRGAERVRIGHELALVGEDRAHLGRPLQRVRDLRKVGHRLRDRRELDRHHDRWLVRVTRQILNVRRGGHVIEQWEERRALELRRRGRRQRHPLVRRGLGGVQLRIESLHSPLQRVQVRWRQRGRARGETRRRGGEAPCGAGEELDGRDGHTAVLLESHPEVHRAQIQKLLLKQQLNPVGRVRGHKRRRAAGRGGTKGGAEAAAVLGHRAKLAARRELERHRRREHDELVSVGVAGRRRREPTRGDRRHRRAPGLLEGGWRRGLRAAGRFHRAQVREDGPVVEEGVHGLVEQRARVLRVGEEGGAQQDEPD